MKTINKLILGLASAAVIVTGCSDFEDLNKDPNAVNEDNVQVAHILNKSFIGAQQNPHIAERLFVLTWKSAARFDRAPYMTLGVDSDGWNADYFGTSYGVGWLNYANLAINLAEKRIANPEYDKPYDKNVLQMARIWRAYLISELADCFGPIPTLNKYDGTVSPYQSVQEIYNFILAELKDATEKIDLSLDMKPITEDSNKSDPFYNGKMENWIKYANSLRLRLAMRLTVVDNAKAKSEVEDVAGKPLILTLDDMAQVQESGGWTDTDGVMSRTWNAQSLSATLNNLMLGIGGIDNPVPQELKQYLKDNRTYMGLKFDQHLTTMTNDPSAGYFFDGLPQKIDPRASTLYGIPGYNDGVVYPTNIPLADIAELKEPKEDGQPYIELTTKFTWNTWVQGKWDKKQSYSSDLLQSKNMPAIARKFRESTNKRVWFAPWETYFLLAEAKTYDWNVPGTAKENYENGVRVSFAYNEVAQYADAYLASTAYNRVGTSAAFDHTTEATPYQVTYIDGYTKEQKTTTYNYPKNSIYRNGDYNNDHLTKIITQKYLAQNPWLPLEAWSDHRRLGLPFWENPAVEIDYNPTAQEVPLTTATAKECRWEFYPKRMRYPSTLEVNSYASYQEAMSLLGGENRTSTPLWWEMKKP